jgi:tRNA G26 N,N-dimethylase Trm1
MEGEKLLTAELARKLVEEKLPYYIEFKKILLDIKGKVEWGQTELIYEVSSVGMEYVEKIIEKLKNCGYTVSRDTSSPYGKPIHKLTISW